jgi:ribosomal protein S6--L-glutamate ligase
MKHFGDYELITEALSFNKVQVIILSNLDSKSSTVNSIKTDCKKRNIPCYALDVNTAFIKEYVNKRNDIKIGDADTKPIAINRSNTVIISRRGVVTSTYTRQLLEDLESFNFFCVNTLDSTMNCENKNTTNRILEAAGLPTPKNAILTDVDGVDKALKDVGGKFPVIIKLLSGSQGIGVSQVDSYESLKSVLQTLWKSSGKSEILLQEMIPATGDLRIHVLSKKFHNPNDEKSEVIAAMKRTSAKKDFRTNYSIGGGIEKVNLTDEMIQVSKDAAKAVDCTWCAVDLIIDKKTKKPYVLEVNASPGTKGITEATGKPVVSIVLDYILNKENWTYPAMNCGFRECVNIPGIGDYVVKMDTGNGSASMTIHGDKFKKSGKYLEWEINGIKFKDKIIGTSEAVGTGGKVHSRPIIQRDLIFAGKLVPKVDISIIDRTAKSTPALANRKFMERLGIVVSPSKAFKLTKFDGGFSVPDSIGDPHGGIKFESK